MLTPKNNFDGRPTGICPNCMSQIRCVASLSGLFEWKLSERCDCRYINDVVEWPFEEDATFEAARPMDLLQFGIVLHMKSGGLRPDIDAMYEELYADLYDDNESDYMDDVDHGWERSYYG